MIIIIYLEGRSVYEHSTDNNVTLAQFLAEIYITLKELGELGDRLNSYPSYFTYFSSPPDRVLTQEDLHKTLGQLGFAEGNIISLTKNKPGMGYLHPDLSVTAILHFVIHPETLNGKMAEKLINTIIQDGEDSYGNTALHLRAFLGTLQEVKLKPGRHIDKQNECIGAITRQSRLPNRCTALHLAAMRGNTVSMLALIQAGANVNLQNKLDMSYLLHNTPLHFSASGGHVAAVQVLLDAEAEVDSKNYFKQTPLLCAVMNKSVSKCTLAVVNLLLGKNADVDAIDELGATPLITLCQTLHNASHETIEIVIKIVKRLIDYETDINAQDNSGRTALHYLARHGCLPVIEYLIKAGANPYILDRSGQNLLPQMGVMKSFVIRQGVAIESGEKSEEEYQCYLDLEGIFKEIRALLLTTIMAGLCDTMPTVLVGIMLDYVSEEEMLSLAKNRVKTLFDQEVKEIKSIDNPERLGEILNQSALLREQSIKDFLAIHTRGPSLYEKRRIFRLGLFNDYFRPQGPLPAPTINEFRNFIVAIILKDKEHQSEFGLSADAIAGLRSMSQDTLGEKFKEWLNNYWDDQKGQLLHQILEQKSAVQPGEIQTYEQYLARSTITFFTSQAPFLLGMQTPPEDKKLKTPFQ